MASGINIYSQLLISLIRIVDINNIVRTLLKFELRSTLRFAYIFIVVAVETKDTRKEGWKLPRRFGPIGQNGGC